MDERILEDLKNSVINYDADEAVALAKTVLAKGYNAIDAIEKGLAVGLDVIGEKYEAGDLFLPELIMAGNTIQSAIEVLQEAFTEGENFRTVLGRVVLGTVEGDIHDIGKTIVYSILTAAGFHVYDMGVNVTNEDFIKKAEEVSADIIGVSALLNSTMLKQKELIQLLTEKGIKDKYKVVVGGAPANQGWADEIGADGYGENAMAALNLCKSLMGVD